MEIVFAYNVQNCTILLEVYKLDIKLPFGLKNDILVHISEINEADRGLKCECICPNCKMKLNARLGNKNRHHFAHYNDNCKNALETSLHLFAKEVLEKHKRIRLPKIEVVNYIYYKKVEDFGKHIYHLNFDEYDIKYLDEDKYSKVILVKDIDLKFDSIEFEKRIDTIIPDIVIYYKGLRLIIEVGVTHFIDNKKEKKIRNLDISTLEINLSNIDYYNFDRKEIEDLIIDGLHNKNWVYNKVAESKKRELIDRNRLALEELKKQEAIDFERRKAKEIRAAKLKDAKSIRIQELLDNDEVKLKEYETVFQTNELWLNFSKKHNMTVDNLPVYLNESVEGEIAFACDRRIWQSHIFEKFILNREDKSILVGNVVRWVSKYSELPINRDFVYTKDVGPNISDLAATIFNYLLRLTEHGFLTIEKNNANFYTRFYIKHNKFSMPEKAISGANPASNELNFYSGKNEYYSTPYKEVAPNRDAIINKAPSISLYEKIAKCKMCGKVTSDWIIYNGVDNSCVCRSCSYSED